MTVRVAAGTTLMEVQERHETTVIRPVDAASVHQPSSPTSSWNVPVGPSWSVVASWATTRALIPGSTALNFTSGTALAYWTVSMETAALLDPWTIEGKCEAGRDGSCVAQN